MTRYIWMEVTPAAISHSVHKFGDRGKYRRVEVENREQQTEHHDHGMLSDHAG